MEMKIPAIAIAAFIVVVVLAGVLMPVLDDAKQTIGDPVTYTNSKLVANKMNYDYGSSVEISTVVDTDGARVYINNVEIERTSDYQLAFLSDRMSAQITSSSAGNLVAFFFFNDDWASSQTVNVSASTTGTATFVYENGSGKLTAVNGTEYEFDGATWAVYPQDGGQFIAHNSSIYDIYTLGKDSDFVIYSADYRTGDLDTAYSYSKGVAYCQNGYTMDVTYNPVLVGGTTDVYYHSNATVTISDGESTETFTPYRCLIPEKVVGHQSSGASYDLLGVIPIMVIVSLLIAVVALIIRSRQF